jgi:hypothetical protein
VLIEIPEAKPFPVEIAYLRSRPMDRYDWSTVFIYMGTAGIMHPMYCWHSTSIGSSEHIHPDKGPIFPTQVFSSFPIRTVQDLEEVVLRALLGYFDKPHKG